MGTPTLGCMALMGRMHMKEVLILVHMCPVGDCALNGTELVARSTIGEVEIKYDTPGVYYYKCGGACGVPEAPGGTTCRHGHYTLCLSAATVARRGHELDGGRCRKRPSCTTRCCGVCLLELIPWLLRLALRMAHASVHHARSWPALRPREHAPQGDGVGRGLCRPRACPCCRPHANAR